MKASEPPNSYHSNPSYLPNACGDNRRDAVE